MCRFAVLLLAGGLAVMQGTYAEPRDFQTFYLTLLIKGPAWTAESTPATDALQQAHLAHLTTLATTGHVTIAGPFGDDGDIRGVVVIKAASIVDARALEEEDPAVRAGRLRAETLAFVMPANWFAFGPLQNDLPMRQFVFGFLNAGPTPAGTPDELARLETNHLQHLWDARQAGALVLAGTIADDRARRAVVVYAVDTMTTARADAEADPSVTSGRFTVELHPWFAADKIMTVAK